MARILVIFAHPAFHKSLANRYLIDAINSMQDVTIRDLYQQYPNGFIDTLAEQSILSQHDILILQHPLYWYSAPALLKEWMDLVLTRSYVYSDSENQSAKLTQMLQVVSCGGSLTSYHPNGYNRYTLRQFLLPFEQTATLCGMRYLPPFVIDGVHKHGDSERLSQFANRYRHLLEQLREESLTIDESCHYLSHPEAEA
ncbi:NAD(P)H-dependent oxidoreductase [Celerinatantimonas sp. MCCC 1A17872]|uniref:NAD(P)H-dependent oxidoreductase n=1 Tax=Celerinatantimonas sp. MCCC 1A17872 TaxID=3177514 RepID=UPI0038BFA4B6